jgi:prepilin-type N-terminal cleavage/methylation domain-containing protein
VIQRTALLDRKGVSLVEVMIALVILLLVFLALMQTALVSIDTNMKNVLRDEAVSIAEQKMNTVRSLPFAQILTDAAALPTPRDCPPTFTVGERVQRSFRNIINKDFCTNITVTDLGISGDNKQVNIRVIWNWKGEEFSHSITTLIRNPAL